MNLERIGDLAVNLAQGVISLREMTGAQVPQELAPMASACARYGQQEPWRAHFSQR